LPVSSERSLRSQIQFGPAEIKSAFRGRSVIKNPEEPNRAHHREHTSPHRRASIQARTTAGLRNRKLHMGSACRVAPLSNGEKE
jgi:hypothetical protein